eukprot:4738411-Prymnesium_polylepis.1
MTLFEDSASRFIARRRMRHVGLLAVEAVGRGVGAPAIVCCADRLASREICEKNEGKVGPLGVHLDTDHHAVAGR